MFTGSVICQRCVGHYVAESTPGFPSKDDERDAMFLLLRRAGAAVCGTRLVDEVLQGVAVHDFIDGVVDFLIKGEGRAAGGFCTGAGTVHAVDRGEGAFGGVEDFTDLDLIDRTGKEVSALRTTDGFQEATLHHQGDDLLEVLHRDLLSI